MKKTHMFRFNKYKDFIDSIKKNFASSYPCICLWTKKYVQRFLNIRTRAFVCAARLLFFFMFLLKAYSRLGNLLKADDIKMNNTVTPVSTR